MIVSVLIFFLIFGILVTSHEFGHFIIAKSSGIRVN
ncbi:MAG: site-2 protease family protein, partial [Butyrivibrio sp.]|nr:site-2 protease family protein [Butyrivibrio sp.]